MQTFHNFETSSNFTSNADGKSSDVFIADSDVGSLFMELSCDMEYNLTAFTIGLITYSDVDLEMGYSGWYIRKP